MALVHSLKWSFFAELASKAVTPVVFIVLARLLTPEDFGVMSAALMVTAFSQIFWEAGMGKALIQRQTDEVDAANVAFWINLGLGIVVASVLFWGAEAIVRIFFRDPRVTLVLQIMTLQVMLGALSSVHSALLQKQMKFKKLFWVRLMTVAVPGLASVPLAWNGLGYWALVVGAVLGQFMQVIVLWQSSDWRPALRFPLEVAKPMTKFGVWVGLSGLLAWFYAWADSLIIGKYLGMHDLGIYRTGNQFASLPFIIIFGPVVPVLYSHLSTIGRDHDRLKLGIEKVIKIIVLIAVPTSILVSSFSDPIALAVFGQKWHGVGFVLSALVLMHGFSWIVGMNGEVYRAMGKPSYETIVTAGVLVVYLSVYIYTVKIGFEVFVWARFVLAIGALLIHLYILKLLLNVEILRIVSSIIFISVFSYMVVGFVRGFIVSDIEGLWVPMLVGVMLSGVLIATFILFVEREGAVKELVALFQARRVV